MSNKTAVEAANKALDILSEIDSLLLEGSQDRISEKVDRLWDGMCPGPGAVLDIDYTQPVPQSYLVKAISANRPIGWSAQTLSVSQHKYQYYNDDCGCKGLDSKVTVPLWTGKIIRQEQSNSIYVSAGKKSTLYAETAIYAEEYGEGTQDEIKEVKKRFDKNVKLLIDQINHGVDPYPQISALNTKLNAVMFPDLYS